MHAYSCASTHLCLQMQLRDYVFHASMYVGVCNYICCASTVFMFTISVVEESMLEVSVPGRPVLENRKLNMLEESMLEKNGI